MADVILTRLEPPANEQPLRDDGAAHTQPWIDYHQSIADRVNTMQTRMRQGVTDGTEATAGQIGEFQTVSVPSGSAITLGNFTIINIARFDLQPGDWDVWGTVVFLPQPTTTMNTLAAWIGQSSATLPGALETEGYTTLRASFLTGGQQVFPVGRVRLLNTAMRTLYLSAVAGFSVSTMVAYGALNARRVR